MLESQQRFYEKHSFILCIYVLAASIACITKISIDLRVTDTTNYISKINNFIVYKNSFFHIIHHQNLYGYFPEEQYDEFLYSPTFALLFAPFAVLPKYIGVVVWCIFNALCVFYAITLLPMARHKKTFILWFILIELITSIQNVQVNPIICSLFLFAFVSFEKKNTLLAALFIVLSIYIKVFGVLGASLFLIYPGRLKFVLYSVVWALVFFCLPLIVISYEELIAHYHQWFISLTADHAKNTEDVSVMHLLSGLSRTTFSESTRLLIQVGAVLLFCLKYLRIKAFDNSTYRNFFLASAMIWCIIFNHAAESATYIIAITGIAIWYEQSEHTLLNKTLLIIAFVCCSLSPTDIFPAFIRQNYFTPFALKALPGLLIYLVLEYNMLFKKDFVELEK